MFAFFAGLLAVAPGMPANAQTIGTIEVNLPAQSLESALRQLVSKEGVQVLFAPEDVKGITTPEVKGRFTPEQVIQKLTEGTGLGYSSNGKNTFAIKPKSGGGKAGAQGGASNKGPTIEAQEQGAGSTTGSSTAEEQNARQSRESIRAEAQKVEKIEVTGSRLLRTAAEGSQEIRTYSREQIEQSGKGTLADFLSTLPEVSVSSVDAPTARYADQTTVQLHGLPAGTTLVLLNGHRVQTNSSGFFDLNNIPLSAVQRLEVLPVGSSAIYGADSLAGAINIVLRRDFDGFESSVRYGNASGTDEFRANMAWGTRWRDGDLSVVGSFDSKSELLGAERDLISNPRFNPYVAFGLDDVCFPGTVYSVNGANLPGLQSSRAAIPAGILGRPTTQNFVSTAGQRNTCGFQKYADVLSPFDREGLLGTGHYKLADSIDVFSEVLLSREIVKSRVGNVLHLYSGTLPASNAFNPFGTDVRVSFTSPGLPFVYERKTTFIRPLIGIRGSLWGDWDYEGTIFTSRDRSEVDQNNGNPSAIGAAFASSDPASALNPFSSGSPGSPQLLASLLTPQTLKFDSQVSTAQGFFRGTLISLPSGPIETVFGGELAKSKIETSASSGTVVQPAVSNSRTAYSLFTEGRAPL